MPYFYSINLRLHPVTQICPIVPNIMSKITRTALTYCAPLKKALQYSQKNAFNKIGNINHVYPPMCHCSSILLDKPYRPSEHLKPYFLHFNIKSSYTSYSIWPLHDYILFFSLFLSDITY